MLIKMKIMPVCNLYSHPLPLKQPPNVASMPLIPSPFFAFITVRSFLCMQCIVDDIKLTEETFPGYVPAHSFLNMFYGVEIWWFWRNTILGWIICQSTWSIYISILSITYIYSTLFRFTLLPMHTDNSLIISFIKRCWVW